MIDTGATIGDAIRQITGEIEAAGLGYGHGVDNAADDAAWLVLGALRLPPEVPPAVMKTVLTSAEGDGIRRLARRRIEERIPTAYLTGNAWFCGLRFAVNPDVLIPRSPLAELIEAGFAPWLPANRPVHGILDLGTGSGCIAVACALAFPEAEVDAVDISERALVVARKNIEDHGLGSRVHTIHSDRFEALDGRVYDLIVSNPPYVDAAEMAALPEEYSHEPPLGLAAGPQGLDFVIPLLREAADHMTEDGLLVVEVGAAEQALVQRYPDIPFLWLDFERGGKGVFLLSKSELQRYRTVFERE